MQIAGKTLGAAAILVAMTASAFAHHGWDWAQEAQTELTGKVVSVTIAPPHPSLEVEAADGLWKIELGNPRLTERSGFNDTSAKPGDEIVVLGNRSLDESEKRMKAVRVTVAGKVYDIYPDRIQIN